MKTPVQEFLFISLLTGCVLVVAAGLGESAHAEREQQRAFISDFYRAYLAPRASPAARMVIPPRSFYSDQAEAMLATNNALCTTLVRDDSICGYGASGDEFLNTMEADPLLTFASAGVTTRSTGSRQVDVSFNVYPEYGVDYARTMRYVLTKQDNGWRVDDVVSMNERGQFPQRDSMRTQILQENERVLMDAADFGSARDTIFAFLRYETMLDRAGRYVRFPLTLCGREGGCEVLRGSDARVRTSLLALHLAYYPGESDDDTLIDLPLPKAAAPAAIPGATVRFDALEFTFRDRRWWISKIDLTQLGSSVPPQGQGSAAR